MKEGYVKSFDNTIVYRYLWDDVESPKGIVQIMHGMSEHAKRYEDFALFLNKNGYKASQFTASENMKDRMELINLFDKGLVNSLVAIRCLDEGVNIPAIQKAFILASSANPKEYIQRRGRVLRKAPGKEYCRRYRRCSPGQGTVQDLRQVLH